MFFRDGNPCNTESANASGCCGGDGGLATRGNGGLSLGIGVGAGTGAASTGALIVCGWVPGFAGSEGCGGAGGWVPVGGACASWSNFASICAILSSVL
jgi:hypothetical protein